MASSIPAATQAVIAIATAALPSDALVWFGEELGVYSAPLTLQITGIEGDQQPAELGPSYRREESYSILCDLVAFEGDQKFIDRLTEVTDAFALLEIAIANNYTLNDSVRFAEVGDFTFTPKANANKQSMGSLTFGIRCTARITSLT